MPTVPVSLEAIWRVKDSGKFETSKPARNISQVKASKNQQATRSTSPKPSTVNPQTQSLKNSTSGASCPNSARPAVNLSSATVARPPSGLEDEGCRLRVEV